MIELPASADPAVGQAQHPWWRRRAAWTYAAILAGELVDHGSTPEVRHRLTTELIGTIALPGGQLVGADPYVMGGRPVPFEQVLPVEEAEVVVVRAHVGPDHERVAALLLVSGSAAVTDWRMATVLGEDPATLAGDRFFGYGVDAGTGAFGGVAAMAVVDRVLAADEGMLDDPISRALFADGVGTRSAVVVAPEPDAAPVAVCSSGWGDGLYPTWLGVDAAGEVVVAVTDFLLTGDPFTPPPVSPGTSEPAPAPRSLLRRLLGRR